MHSSPTQIYPYLHTLSLHDALPIFLPQRQRTAVRAVARFGVVNRAAGPFRRAAGETAQHDEAHQLAVAQRAVLVAQVGQIRVGAQAGRVDDPAAQRRAAAIDAHARSEEHTSELQSLMRNSYAVFCL